MIYNIKSFDWTHNVLTSKVCFRFLIYTSHRSRGTLDLSKAGKWRRKSRVLADTLWEIPK